MKKFIFSVIVLISCFLISFAQSGDGYALVVEHSGGSTQFLLSSRPVISYSGDNMLITAPEGKFTYLRSEVNRLYFTQQVNSAEITKSDLKVSLSGGLLSVSGIENAGEVKVYDLTGRRLNINSTVEAGAVVLNLSQLSKDTYIISIPNHQSLKISLK